jgi:hypothetical protein
MHNCTCAEPSATLYPHNDEDDSVEMETIKAKKMEDFKFDKLSKLVQQKDSFIYNDMLPLRLGLMFNIHKL